MITSGLAIVRHIHYVFVVVCVMVCHNLWCALFLSLSFSISYWRSSRDTIMTMIHSRSSTSCDHDVVQPELQSAVSCTPGASSPNDLPPSKCHQPMTTINNRRAAFANVSRWQFADGEEGEHSWIERRWLMMTIERWVFRAEFVFFLFVFCIWNERRSIECDKNQEVNKERPASKPHTHAPDVCWSPNGHRGRFVSQIKRRRRRRAYLTDLGRDETQTRLGQVIHAKQQPLESRRRDGTGTSENHRRRRDDGEKNGVCDRRHIGLGVI